MYHKSLKNKGNIFSVAPMMEWTDRHCRFFLRLISRRALLYTEMVTTGAVIHGDRDKLLGFHDGEHPVALQLGGNDPADLAASARIGADYGYDEINLNVGCPSDRVQEGCFGAALMAEPLRVASCVAAMRDVVSVPITVKCRIGIDDMDIEGPLDDFVGQVAEAGCETIIVHARKAWLNGLNPKQNRDVPPLDYDRVHRLKQSFPDLTIILNGGLETLDEAEVHLPKVDGVMMGRAAYQNSYILADVDRRFFGDESEPLSRVEIIERLLPYVDEELSKGTRFNQIARHLMGLYQGVPRARIWRRHISENATKPGASGDVLREALDLVQGGERDLSAAAE